MAITWKTPTGVKFMFDIDYDDYDKQRKVDDRLIHITTAIQDNTHSYRLRALRDLYIWLKVYKNCEWIPLGSRGEEEQPNPGTVEEWARHECNPVGGFYGVTPGRRGRFASYIPSVLECLGFVEIEHNAKNNRVRAL